MAKPTLVLVGAKDDTVQKAAALGIDIILLQHPAKVTDRQLAGVQECHVVDYTDWRVTRPVIESLRRYRPIDYVMSLTEAGVENAGRANDLLGLSGAGYVVARRFRNKRAMRDHLAEAGFDTLGHAPLRSRRDLNDFAVTWGYPFVVKPVDATAGVGVMVLAGADDLSPAWQRAQSLAGTRTDRGSTLYFLSDFVMESYVEGPELSVETMSYGGRHVVLSVTEKFVSNKGTAEIGHAVPARTGVAADAQIRHYVRSLLDVMGLRDGPSHTEVRLGPTGPQVIETHNRPGGGAIPALVKATTGLDQAVLALAAPFGLVTPPAHDPSPAGGAASRFLAGGPGEIRSINGFDDLREHPQVLAAQALLKIGQRVGRLRDNWDRVGMAAVSADDPGQALELAAALLDKYVTVQLVTDEGSAHNAYVAPLDAAAHCELLEVAL